MVKFGPGGNICMVTILQQSFIKSVGNVFNIHSLLYSASFGVVQLIDYYREEFEKFRTFLT